MGTSEQPSAATATTAATTTAITVTHRFIVASPDTGSVLVLDSRGGVHLPRIETPDRHTADTDYLVAAVLHRWGLVCTVLRSLSHSALVDGGVRRAHELELHTGAVVPPLRWCNDVALFTDAEDRAALARWREPGARGVVDGREWTRPGWFGGVRSWLVDAVQRAGGGSVREIVQLRAWSSSCVLKVVADDLTCYFKAVPTSGAVECEVSAYLARRFVGNVPEVLVYERNQRWLLMRAFPGVPLDTVDDVALWAEAAARYGRLQAASAARIPELERLGCKMRPLAALVDSLARLTATDDLVRGLPADERTRLLSSVPALRANAVALAALPLPLVLEHGDLWPGNVLIDGVDVRIIDWEDANIGHPLLGLAPLYVGLSFHPRATADVLARVERAYLNEFPGFAGADVTDEALRLARPLAFVDMALRYSRQRASTTSLHPWMRDLVPEALRRAIALL